MLVMNIFNGLKVYAQKWQVKGIRKFSEEELKFVDHAYVVPSEYGNSACFVMVGGGVTFVPMSNDSTLTTGEVIDLKKAEIITLEKDGADDIQRIKA